MPKRSFKPGID